MGWLILFVCLLAIFAGGIFYLINRIRKFKFVKSLGKKWLERLVALLIILVVLIVLTWTMSYINAIVCFLHLMLFWLVSDLCFWIFGKIIRSKKTELNQENDRNKSGIYRQGVVAIGITILYFACGWYFAHHVVRTDYEISSTKQSAEIKVAMIADSHLGTTFNGKEMGAYLKEIEALNPDVLLIAGDMVDDGTSKEDFLDVCEVISNLKIKDGIYFVFGNHDRGYYNSRNFDETFLVKKLEESGVTVLQDDVVLVNESYYIIGREDKSVASRMTMEELTADLDKTKYVIVMDHQPTDYESEAAAYVDLVVSGHTHGGQLLPIKYVGEWTGINDATYGYERRNNTDFILTSGISDWEIKFKTGCISEYVIVNINN